MAKSSGKSTKKSGNTRNASMDAGSDGDKSISASAKKSSGKKRTKARKDASSNKGRKSSGKGKNIPKKEIDTPEKKKKTPGPRKESVLKCQFCQKTMKDRKTLNIHERNCQAKKDQETEKKLKSAMLRMKDDFEDERQAIVDQFSKREEALQNELDEIKTVLRMEINRHRKELDMINEVKKETQRIIENSSEPATNHEPEKEPIQMPHSRARAIDMIPMPLPDIPKKIIEPVLIDRETEKSIDTVSTIPKDMNQGANASNMPPARVREPAITSESGDEEPGEKITTSIQTVAGLSRKDVEELVKSLIGDSINRPSDTANADLDELKFKIEQMSSRLNSLDYKLDNFNTDIKNNIERIKKESNIRKIEKELAKVSDRVLDMMEDIGFGEELSVTKIPPTILEIVYQATLDDIHREIVRTMGAQDAEKIFRAALEDVRLKTSGSELFKFNGRKIITDNLARSIEANMISAKQIQTTYDVLQERLLESIPHHKAKNFRGMIKVKSQEFAVDRATMLTKEYTRMSKTVESSSQMLAAISAQANARNQEIQDALDDIRNNLLAHKANIEDIEHLRIKIQEWDEKDAKLNSELALLKAEIEMKEEMKTKESEKEFRSIIIPGETIDTEEIIEENNEKSKTDISQRVLESIQNGAGSKTAIIRETGMEEEDILGAIAILVNDNRIIEKKIGKRIKYLTPEQDINEKLKLDGKKKNKKESAGNGVTKKVVKPPKVSEQKSEMGSKKQKAEPKPVTEKSSKKYTKKQAKKPAGKGKTKTEKQKQSAGKKKDAKERAKKPAGKEETTDKQKIPYGKEPKSNETKNPEIAGNDGQEKVKKPSNPTGKSGKESKKPNSLTEETTAPEKSESKEEHVDDGLPVITKKLEDLSDDEYRVLDVMTNEGMTISGIQSKAGKGMKRFALLRALRVLIDSGYVGIITKGRMDLYRKLDVKKMDKMKKDKTNKEVK